MSYERNLVRSPPQAVSRETTLGYEAIHVRVFVFFYNGIRLAVNCCSGLVLVCATSRAASDVFSTRLEGGKSSRGTILHQDCGQGQLGTFAYKG